MSCVSHVQMKAQLLHWQKTLDAMVIDHQSTARLGDIQHIYDKCVSWQKEVECIPEYSQCLMELQAIKSKVKNIFNQYFLQAAPSKLDRSLATRCKRDLKMLCVALRKGEGANIEKNFSALPNSVKMVIGENLFTLRLASGDNPSSDELDFFIHNDGAASTLDMKYQAIIRSLPFDIAFDIAAAAGDVARIKSFLQAHRSEIPSHTLEDAFVSAATTPHIEILQLLCASVNTIPPSILHNIISAATRSGQKEVLQAAFSLQTSISQDCLWEGMLCACDQPDPTLFEFLLLKIIELFALDKPSDKKFKLEEDTHFIAIYEKCCANGRIDLLNLLHDKLTIQLNKNTEDFLQIAINNHRVEVVSYILEQISVYMNVGVMVEHAIKADAADVIPLLYSHVHFLDRNQYMDNLRTAIMSQNPLLLQNVLLPDLRVVLTEADVHNLYTFAQTQKSVHSLAFLLETFPFLQHHDPLLFKKNEIILDYIINSDVKAVRSLLAQGLHIRPYLFYRCLFLAVEYNNVEILSLFIHGEYAYEMDDEIRTLIAYKAGVSGRIECLKSLISTGKIGHYQKRQIETDVWPEHQREVVEALTQATIYYENNFNPVSFNVRLQNLDRFSFVRAWDVKVTKDDIVKRPKNILQKIVKEGLARRYSVVASATEIFRSEQIYESLFYHLKKSGYLPNYLGIPYFAPDDEEKTSVFSMIGKLYCDFFIMNQGINDPEVLGDVFSCEFFSLLEIAIKSIYNGDSQEILDAKLLQKYKNCDTWAKDCFLFLENLDDDSLMKKVRELMKWQQKSGSAQEFAEQVFFSFKAPVAAVIQGAIATDIYDPLFSAFINQSAEEVCERLQGKKKNKEDILSAICPLSQDPNLLQKVDWIKEKITIAFETSDFDFLSGFLRCFIGRSSWKKNQKIYVDLLSSNVNFFIRVITHKNRLEIKNVSRSKDDFIYALSELCESNFIYWHSESFIDLL